MPKRRPGPFPLVPAPLSGSREQIREHRGGEARTGYGKAEASLDPGRPCALVVEIQPKVSGNDPQQSVRTCARTGA